MNASTLTHRQQFSAFPAHLPSTRLEKREGTKIAVKTIRIVFISFLHVRLKGISVTGFLLPTAFSFCQQLFSFFQYKFLDRNKEFSYFKHMETKTESFRKAVVSWLEATKSNTRDLADYANCSESTLQKWLTNETINITLERALAIANVIGYEFEV